METEGVPCGNDKCVCSCTKLELFRTQNRVQIIGITGVFDVGYRKWKKGQCRDQTGKKEKGKVRRATRQIFFIRTAELFYSDRHSLIEI